MDSTFQINTSEAEILLEWLEYYSTERHHFGGRTLVLPAEELFKKRLSSVDTVVEISEHELDLISDCMKSVISNKYGSSSIATNSEITLVYRIIKRVEELQANEKTSDLVDGKKVQEIKSLWKLIWAIDSFVELEEKKRNTFFSRVIKKIISAFV